MLKNHSMGCFILKCPTQFNICIFYILISLFPYNFIWKETTHSDWLTTNISNVKSREIIGIIIIVILNAEIWLLRSITQDRPCLQILMCLSMIISFGHLSIKIILHIFKTISLKMPHKAVYSQPFEQNICITRICSLVRINLAQIYYEYFGCSFEYQ